MSFLINLTLEILLPFFLLGLLGTLVGVQPRTAYAPMFMVMQGLYKVLLAITMVIMRGATRFIQQIRLAYAEHSKINFQ